MGRSSRVPGSRRGGRRPDREGRRVNPGRIEPSRRARLRLHHERRDRPAFRPVLGRRPVRCSRNSRCRVVRGGRTDRQSALRAPGGRRSTSNHHRLLARCAHETMCPFRERRQESFCRHRRDQRGHEGIAGPPPGRGLPDHVHRRDPATDPRRRRGPDQGLPYRERSQI